MPPRQSYSPTPAPGTGGGHPALQQLSGPVPSHQVWVNHQRGAPQCQDRYDDPDAPSVEDQYAQLSSDRRRGPRTVTRYISPEEAVQMQLDDRSAEQAAADAAVHQQNADLRQRVADLEAAAMPGRKAVADLAILSKAFAELRTALDETRAELKLLRESAGAGSCSNCGSVT